MKLSKYCYVFTFLKTLKTNMCLTSIQLFIVRTIFMPLFPTYTTVTCLFVVLITQLFAILFTLLLAQSH